MVAEEFLLRELDVIRVVGQKKPVKIFQLMGKKGNPLVRQDVESLFKAGRDLYTQREWTAAIEKFRGVLALSPEDGPSQKYIARCEEYAETPPPGDWDGVYQMMSK